jgi:hypothetical protein
MDDRSRSLAAYRRGGDIYITITYYVTQVTSNNSHTNTFSDISGTVSVVQDSENVRITNQINALKEHPETRTIARAFEELQQVINASTELDTPTNANLVNAISSLSEQASKDSSQRTWVIKPAFDYMHKTISTVGSLVTIWSKLGGDISSFFGIV